MDTMTGEQFLAHSASYFPFIQKSDYPLHLHPLGGQRLRSQLVAVIHQLWPHPHHSRLAAAIECIHMASLLHDDVLDQSLIRREGPSGHCLWGVKPAILRGDWWLAHGLKLLGQCQNSGVRDVMDRCLVTLVRGQLTDAFPPKACLPLWRHLVMVGQKTGVLFGSTAQCTGLLSRVSASCAQELYQSGFSMGVAYQLADDLAEFLLPPEQWDHGHDWIQGKKTYLWLFTQSTWSNAHQEHISALYHDVISHLSSHKKQKKGKTSARFPFLVPTPQVFWETLSSSLQARIKQMVADLEPGIQACRDMHQRYIQRATTAWENATGQPVSQVVMRLLLGNSRQF